MGDVGIRKIGGGFGRCSAIGLRRCVEIRNFWRSPNAFKNNKGLATGWPTIFWNLPEEAFLESARRDAYIVL